MNWWKAGVIAWLVLASLVSVGTVGKPRKPTEPSIAVISLIITAGLIFCVVKA